MISNSRIFFQLYNLLKSRGILNRSTILSRPLDCDVAVLLLFKSVRICTPLQNKSGVSYCESESRNRLNALFRVQSTCSFGINCAGISRLFTA